MGLIGYLTCLIVFSGYLATLTDNDKQARLEAIHQTLEPHGEFHMPSPLRIQ
jgi:hypothetical protein